MTVTIYHNPACGTSRNVLAMIRNAGVEPTVIEYLKTPPSRETLIGLAARIGAPIREIMRRKGTPYDALGLDRPNVTDAALLDAIERHPILINRPIVVSPLGVALCRPSEIVLDLLEQPQRTEFVKEDGEPVVVALGMRNDALEPLAMALAAAGLPNAGIAAGENRFYRFVTTLGRTVGFGGIAGFGADRLLRSLVVEPNDRGHGYGRATARSLERLAVQDGAARLHLLTIDAAPFFAKLGYGIADRAAAPDEIAASSAFSTLCPASAFYLVKSVRANW